MGIISQLCEILKKIDIRDIFTFGGLILLAIGLWQIYYPASYIAIGIFLLYLGVWHGNNIKS